MLNKIINIKNIGRFNNSAASGDTTLSKHSFVFGANGSGKTTICSILRSLQTNDVSLLLGRKTLGTDAASQVELLTTSGNIKFDGTAWNSNNHRYAIFDSVFVSENVYSGDTIDTDQKRNLYRVIVGETGVALAEKEKKLVEKIKKLTNEITSIIKTITSHIPERIALKEYLSLPKIENIDKELSLQISKIEALKKSLEIKNHAQLETISAPKIPDHMVGLLLKTIENISAESEREIKEHLDAHAMGSDSHWILKGLDHVQDSCPFCGQNIDDLTLIKAYQDVFSEKYKGLRKEIKELRTTIEVSFGEPASAALNISNEKHNSGIEFWKKYCDFDQSSITYPAAYIDTIELLYAETVALLKQKEHAPLEALAVSDSYKNAISKYEQEREIIRVFNESIISANKVIERTKSHTEAEDETTATKELARLTAIKTRYSETVSKICMAYENFLTKKSELEQEKLDIRSDLNTHTQSVVEPYEKRINEFLDDFNADFTIAKTKHNYQGGIATSDYQLVINDTHIKVGGSSTSNDVPCFKNTLSAGDKSTLALAFFLAHLESDNKIASQVVVFDDPFNSQDSFRRRQTIHAIMGVAEKCEQVIILSHDATFLKQVWEKCPSSERVAIHLANHGDMGSKIERYDLEEACKSRTLCDIDDLQKFYTSGAGQHVDVIRKMRTVLETYMKDMYPSSFNNNDWLGDIVGKIRKGGAGHPVESAYNKLDEINDYTSQYHHGEDRADIIPDTIDPNELRGYAKRTLRIVNAWQG